MRRNFEQKLNYSQIKDVDFRVSFMNTEEFNGYVHLASIHKVSEAIFRSVDDKIIKIMDNEYKWLQITPLNANYNLITILDDKDEILQWEFHIIDNNEVDGKIGLMFEDLILSLLVLPNGMKNVLGEEEIKKALYNNDINLCQFDKAYREIKILEQIISIDKLINLSRDMLKNILGDSNSKKQFSCEA
jgi:predicted RNA-binding protein associated with RNAse of E/G family